MATSRSGAGLTLEHLGEMDTDRPPVSSIRRPATTPGKDRPEVAILPRSRCPQGDRLPGRPLVAAVAAVARSS